MQSLSEEAWTNAKTCYKAFVSLADIDVELERWKFKFTDSTEKKGMDYCYAATKNLYPNLHSIFGVLLTMPVSVASGERSFSTLKRLKTYLRSTMDSERLNGLALMHIHSRIATDIDVEQVLREFDSSGHRRIVLALQATAGS